MKITYSSMQGTFIFLFSFQNLRYLREFLSDCHACTGMYPTLLAFCTVYTFYKKIKLKFYNFILKLFSPNDEVSNFTKKIAFWKYNQILTKNFKIFYKFEKFLLIQFYTNQIFENENTFVF